MDELGIATLLLIAGDTGRHAVVDPFDFEHLVARWDEAEHLVERWPGRFAALALIDPERGMRGVRDTRARLEHPWVVGCYLHTHSWDRRLDHADYYPYYAACAEAGVPVAAQAGTSGGLMASECGRPISIDRPALYFRDTSVRPLAPRVALERRGDRDGAEVPERVPRYRRVPASPLARRACTTSYAVPAAPR